MTIVSLLHSNDKELKEIQQIIESIKAANLAKYAIRAITNLAIIAKKKHLDKQNISKSKTNEKCFNCRKKSYYAKNCYFWNKKMPKELVKKAKCTW